MRGLVAAAWVLATAAVGAAQSSPATLAVSGRLSIQEKDNRPSRDLANSVVWLEGPAAPPATRGATFDVLISDKTYAPRVLVVPLGSTVRFPNRDPFNHNVFWVVDSGVVDLGLFGRGETRQHVLRTPGLLRVFCNVHPRMVAYVHVAPNAWITQPGADGSFRIEGVPPGRYQLHAWHERVAATSVTEIEVRAGAPALAVTLDARGYRWVQHRNKQGQAYTASRERY
jgi:plastocyanin